MKEGGREGESGYGEHSSKEGRRAKEAARRYKCSVGTDDFCSQTVFISARRFVTLFLFSFFFFSFFLSFSVKIGFPVPGVQI